MSKAHSNFYYWDAQIIHPDFLVIAKGYDDEVGYEIKPTIDGNYFTINHVIG